MTISELEKILAALREEHGDLPVVCRTMDHQFPPDPEVRSGAVVVLNP